MTTPSSETIAAVLDDTGMVVNMIVVDPATVAEYETVLQKEAQARGGKPPVVRTLSAEERNKGITMGWKRSANGVFVDERPPPEPVTPPTPPPAP